VPDAGDLKVVITADTKQMEAGFNRARTVVKGFDQEVGVLGKLDGGLTAIVGRVTMLTAAFATLSAAWALWSARGAQAMEAVGMGEEFNETIEAGKGLIEVLAEALPLAARSAAAAVGEAMSQITEASEEAAEEQQGFWEKTKGLIDQVKEAAKGYAASLKDATSVKADDVGPLIAALRREIEYITKRADDMWGKSRGDIDSMLGVAYQVGEILEKINLLSGMARDNVRGMAMARPDAVLEQAVEDMREAIKKARDEVETFNMSAAQKMRRDLADRFSRDGEATSGNRGIPAQMEPYLAELDMLEKRKKALEADKKAREDNAEAAKAAALALERTMIGAEREIQALESKANKLTMTARAAAELEMREKLLLNLRQRNVVVTEAEMVRVNALSVAYADATEKLRAIERQMQIMQDIGASVSRTLETAFGNFITGTKTNFRDLIHGMLADMAKLALRAAVLEPLLGGGQTKGGGLLGSLISGLVGGGGGGGVGAWTTTTMPAFAEGGRPPMGRPSLVGERGPELFVPDVAGVIVPNHELGGGGVSVTVVNQINAQGAYPESIEQIRDELRRVEQRMPGQVIATVREAQERGGL
jgi:hypothetical protein